MSSRGGTDSHDWDPREWGWRDDACADPFEDADLGRVIRTSHGLHTVVSSHGELTARMVGNVDETDLMPVVGDWVAVEVDANGPRQLRVLPRSSTLARKHTGSRTASQIVGANIDAVFIVVGLDGDFNLRRLERFVVMVSASGAQPVVVLTKADLAPDAAELRLQAMDVAPGQPVFAVSAIGVQGLEPLHAYLQRGRTVALIGSSGAGKSTLLNTLAGAPVMSTGEVREDDNRGRHTTTHRELVRLPSGAMLIDNPGVREVQLWADDAEAVDEAFADIATIAEGCRFGDCTHSSEPGCAVLAAVEAGELPTRRLENMHQLQRELESLELRRDEVQRRRAGRRQGRIYRQAKKTKQNFRRDRR